MSNQDKWQVMEDIPDVTYDIPTAKFFSNLMKNYFITNNYEEFCLRQDVVDEESGELEDEIVAMVRIKLLPSTVLPYDVMTQNTAYISSLAIREDNRGMGLMPVINHLLISCAEDAGIFLYGYARNYIIEIPRMKSVEEYNDWLSGEEKSSHFSSLKKDKERAKKLHKAYLNQGYCRYDMTGFRMGNRYWKKMGFGYASSKIEDKRLLKHINNHLNC